MTEEATQTDGSGPTNSVLMKPSEVEAMETPVDDLAGDDSAITQAEIDEAFSPGLSIESFDIGGRSFKIQISNIRTQKQMAKALDSITELTQKLDVSSIVEAYNQRTTDRIEAGVTANVATEMVELIQDIIQRGGISNMLIMLMDLFIGIVHAICQSQHNDVTREWLEDNLNGVSQAQEIVFAQMEKDNIGGRVIDFLQIATRAVVG